MSGPGRPPSGAIRDCRAQGVHVPSLQGGRRGGKQQRSSTRVLTQSQRRNRRAASLQPPGKAQDALTSRCCSSIENPVETARCAPRIRGHRNPTHSGQRPMAGAWGTDGRAQFCANAETELKSSGYQGSHKNLTFKVQHKEGGPGRTAQTNPQPSSTWRSRLSENHGFRPLKCLLFTGQSNHELPWKSRLGVPAMAQ